MRNIYWKEEGRRKKEEGRIKILNRSIITISLGILWAIVMGRSIFDFRLKKRYNEEKIKFCKDP
ncbi:hypothetical protein QUA82_18700 [Microcoleus sp. F8-D3]